MFSAKGIKYSQVLEVLIILLVCQLACFFPAELVIKAADMSYKSTGGAIKEEWSIWSNGFISEIFDFPENGEYKFTITARGDKAFNVWPVMKVSCNDKEVFTGSADSTELKPFSFIAEIEKGYCRLKIHFTNDVYVKEKKEDRNLYVAQLKIEDRGSGLLPRLMPKEKAEQIQSEKRESLMKKIKEQTEKIRTGELEITVVDKEGKAITNAGVTVNQQKHEFWFGTAISSAVNKFDKTTREKFLNILKENFNSAVHENALKWYGIEQEKGKLRYEDADKILAWCEKNNISMRGHCIFWEVESVLQQWIKDLNKEELRQAVLKRARELPERYKGRIGEYDVNNEMMHGSFYKDRLGEGIWKEMFETVHKSDPAAVLYVNDYEIMENGFMDEEYAAHIKHLLDMGALVGGIGIQGHFSAAVDPFLVEKSLEVLSKFELPIKITEFDIDSVDEQVKAEGLETLYRICFAYPRVKGILMWGFWEGAHWRPGSALFKKDFSPTPAAIMHHKLVYDEWWTRAKGKTDAKGIYSCRPYFGDHIVTITAPDGKILTQKVSIKSEEKNKKIKITMDAR